MSDLLKKLMAKIEILTGWKTILGSTGIALSFIAGLFGKAITAADAQAVIDLTLQHWEFVISGTVTWWGIVSAKLRAMKPTKKK